MTSEYNIITPQKFVDVLKRRVKKDWDAVVAITGEEGSSKSTLASWLVWESLMYDGIEEEEALKKFVEYTIFSPSVETVKEQITKSERYSIINADEAIKILYKQNWATPIQKFLNMFYALCRQENKISVLCMPRFLDFNEFFRNHRIKFWIHVIDRGVAIIFEKDWFPASADPWFIKDAQKINYTLYNRRKTGDFNTEQKIQTLSKLKNFIGVIKFDDLPEDIKRTYKTGKAEHAYENLEDQIQTVAAEGGSIATRYREMIVKSVNSMLKRGYNQKQVAEMLQMDRSTIRRYTNRGDGDGVLIPSNNEQTKEDYFE